MLILPAHQGDCPTIADSGPLRACWHALWWHGWNRFTRTLLAANRDAAPARFVAALLAFGAALGVVALVLLASAATALLHVFT